MKTSCETSSEDKDLWGQTLFAVLEAIPRSDQGLAFATWTRKSRSQRDESNCSHCQDAIDQTQLQAPEV